EGEVLARVEALRVDLVPLLVQAQQVDGSARLRGPRGAARRAHRIPTTARRQRERKRHAYGKATEQPCLGSDHIPSSNEWAREGSRRKVMRDYTDLPTKSVCDDVGGTIPPMRRTEPAQWTAFGSNASR